MEKPYYIAVVNDELKITLQEDKGLDLVATGPGSFHVIQHDNAFAARVKKVNFAEREVHIDVNGELYRVQLRDRFDQLVDELGFSTGQEQRVDEIKAPMPGLVLKILVEKGQEVSTGDTLLILEAMKMENVIKSPGTGTISAISIEEGQAVEKGQVMLRLD